MTVSPFERAAYQRTVRGLLSQPLVTQTYPDQTTLPLVRRWAEQLRIDLAEAFGYRLELTAATARLIRTLDELDASQPASTGTDRPFDRRRYAYLALTLAALGRAGTQLALSELAETVGADARRIEGLGMSTDRAADRSAFVDAVAWLETRGALRLADGSARRWADDPEAGEALYDIDRDIVAAVYRPTRVLQHLRSITGLLGPVDGTGSPGMGRDVHRREAAQRARRALVEQPVVYYDGAHTDVRNMLRGPHAVADVERLTGLVAERRSEGIAMLDTSGSFSDRRFPGTGTVAQTALLLIGEIAARIDDADAPPLAWLAAPDGRRAALAASVDAALPGIGVLDALTDTDAGSDSDTETDADAEADFDTGTGTETETAADAYPGVPGRGARGPEAEQRAPATYPLLEEGWLQGSMAALVERYGTTFATAWRADPERLLGAALELLTGLGIVAPVQGGVLALPLLARYRQVAVQVRRREPEPSLFD